MSTDGMPNIDSGYEQIYEENNQALEQYEQEIEQDYAGSPTEETVSPGSESALSPEEEEQIIDEMNQESTDSFNETMNEANEFDETLNSSE